MEIEIPVKAYSKSELAQLYNPSMCCRSAMRTLRKWISLNKELSAALCATGYRSTQHIFTPHQVELIFLFLGKP